MACAFDTFREYRNVKWTIWTKDFVQSDQQNYNDRTENLFFSIFRIVSLQITIGDHLYIKFSQETFQPFNTFRKVKGSHYKMLL